ncbi:MAG TPA: helix-turn-helix transcriptional regulator [Gammaproteobacteria bacterium]
MRGIDKDSRYYKEFSRFTSKLAEKIYALRLERGLTQEDMQAFELSLRQYQRIEQGQTVNMTLSNIYKICKAFDVKPHELLDI